MRFASMAAWVLLTAGRAAAQDDLDTDLEKLATKLAKDGVTGQLAELFKSDEGRLVVREAITTLVSRATDRHDRDMTAYYERHFFTEDAAGNLTPRPERKAELEGLAREVARRTGNLAPFLKACDGVTAAIKGDGDFENRARAYWNSPDFRLALYFRLDGYAREPHPEMLFHRLIGRALHRGTDGKLHVRGPHRDEVLSIEAQIRGELEGLAPFEDRLPKGKHAASPEGRVLLLRRIAENPEDPDFNVDEAHAALTAVARDFAPIIARTVAELPDAAGNDRRIRSLLTDPQGVALLCDLARQTIDERRAYREIAVENFRNDHFDVAEDGSLTVKAGRWESPDAMAGEFDNYKNEMNNVLIAFEEISSRVLDASLVELFESKPGASALYESLIETVEGLKEQVRDAGVERFIQSYLVKKGDVLIVRPERAGRVEAMVKRAGEVKAAMKP